MHGPASTPPWGSGLAPPTHWDPPHCSLSKPKMDLRGQVTSNMWLNPKELEPKICPSPPTPAHHMQSNTLKPPTHNPCTLSTNQHTETHTPTHTLTYTLTNSGVASVTTRAHTCPGLPSSSCSFTLSSDLKMQPRPLWRDFNNRPFGHPS